MAGNDAVNDERIRSLTEEVNGLRQRAHDVNDKQQASLLKLTEIQLNLAAQDKTIDRIDKTVNGNGRPGLVSRVYELEQAARTVSIRHQDWKKFLWMIIGVAITLAGTGLTHALWK